MSTPRDTRSVGRSATAVRRSTAAHRSVNARRRLSGDRPTARPTGHPIAVYPSPARARNHRLVQQFLRLGFMSPGGRT